MVRLRGELREISMGRQEGDMETLTAGRNILYIYSVLNANNHIFAWKSH